MWPQTNKSSSHQNLTWEQSLDPCQQNYRPRHWWFILFKICLQIALWKGYSSNLGSCLAPGSSSENSWYITQSFPRGMSEMCVKYPTFKTQKQINDQSSIFLGNSVTNLVGYGCKGSQEAICIGGADVRDDEVWQCLIWTLQTCSPCSLHQHMLEQI